MKRTGLAAVLALVLCASPPFAAEKPIVAVFDVDGNRAVQKLLGARSTAVTADTTDAEKARSGPAGIVWIHSAPAGIEFTKSEITVAQYRACVEAGKCTAPKSKSDNKYCNWGYADRDNHPVNCVDWHPPGQVAGAFLSKIPSGDAFAHRLTRLADFCQRRQIVKPLSATRTFFNRNVVYQQAALSGLDLYCPAYSAHPAQSASRAFDRGLHATLLFATGLFGESYATANDQALYSHRRIHEFHYRRRPVT